MSLISTGIRSLCPGHVTMGALSDLKRVQPKLRFFLVQCNWSVVYLPFPSCHAGPAEASQVQREVPEQTPECFACVSCMLLLIHLHVEKYHLVEFSGKVLFAFSVSCLVLCKDDVLTNVQQPETDGCTKHHSQHVYQITRVISAQK